MPVAITERIKANPLQKDPIQKDPNRRAPVVAKVVEIGQRFECDCLATGVGTEKFQQWSVPGTGKLVVVFQG